MKSVVIGFSRPKQCKPGSAIIRAWQGGTKFSHVYLQIFSNYTKETLVYQASHGMVNCMHHSAFLAQNVVVREFSVEVTEDALRSCVKKAQQLLGTPYGYLGLIKLGLYRLTRSKLGDGTKSMHCSEFIGCLFPELSQSIGVTPDYLEPVHLYNKLVAK